MISLVEFSLQGVYKMRTYFSIPVRTLRLQLGHFVDFFGSNSVLQKGHLVSRSISPPLKSEIPC